MPRQSMPSRVLIVAIVFTIIGAGMTYLLLSLAGPPIVSNDPQPPTEDYPVTPKLDPVGTDLAGRPIYSFAVHAIAFGSDSKRLVIGAGDGGVYVIPDITAVEPAYSAIKAHDDWAFSVLPTSNGGLITGGGDNRSIAWDPGMLPLRFFETDGHSNDVHAVALSPDEDVLYTTGDDRRLIAWSMEDGRVLYDVEPHDEQVPAMRMSPDGLTLATGSRDNKLRIIRARDGKVERTIASHNNDILDLAFSPDGQRIATASYDSTVMIHDVVKGEAIHTLHGHKDRVFAVAFSPDGKTLVSGGEDHDLVFYDTADDYKVDRWIDTGEDISRLAFSPDGQYLAAASSSGWVTVYDAITDGIVFRIQYTSANDPKVRAPASPGVGGGGP